MADHDSNLTETTATAAADPDVIVAAPATVERPVLIKQEEGRVTVAYSEGRPKMIGVTPDLLDDIVSDLNAFRDLAEAQQTALAAYALGNRPGGKVLEAVRAGQQRFGIL